MAPSLPDVKPESVSRSSGKKTKRPNYRRRVKSPYTFAELITIAIKESPTGMLTLRQIQDHLAATYECFQGSYVGWKNSVRHNLSVNDCFTKVLKDKTKPTAKDNYWSLNKDCTHCKAACLRPGRVHQRQLQQLPPAGSPTVRPQPTTEPSHNAGLTSDTPGSVRDFPCTDWEGLQDLSIPDKSINFSLYDDQWYGSATNRLQAQPTSGLVPNGNNPWSHQSRNNFPEHYEHFAGNSYHSVSWRESRCTNGCRGVPCFLRTDPIIVPAIRCSLGLDLDKMALSAIEHSVQVLDKIRPCDLLSS